MSCFLPDTYIALNRSLEMKKSAQDMIEGRILKIWEWVEVEVVSTLVVADNSSLFILREASLVVVVVFPVVLDLIFDSSEARLLVCKRFQVQSRFGKPGIPILLMLAGKLWYIV